MSGSFSLSAGTGDSTALGKLERLIVKIDAPQNKHLLPLGKLSAQQDGSPLTPFTVVIGKNGVGKSSLFDAFGFVADCLATDVETACDMKQRGGFERLRSKGMEEPIRFEIYYREAQNERPITYELAIDMDNSGRPFVLSETLKQRRKGQKHGRPFPFLRLDHGKGTVWAGEEAVDDEQEESNASSSVELTDPRSPATLRLGDVFIIEYIEDIKTARS